MYSNTHHEEGEGHRRTRSGRSSKRSSRSDTVDDDLLSPRAPRNEDERKARKTRQKLELRAKQSKNGNEGATSGSGDSIPVFQGGPNNMGYGPFSGDAVVTTLFHNPHGASSNSCMPHGQEMEIASGVSNVRGWAGAAVQGYNGIQEDIQRLRVSNTPPPRGEDTIMRGGSPQHRWGRVFAERGTPLSRIGAEASQSPLQSPGTPPLQRRAAVRRRRMHASDTTITNPVNFVELSTNRSLPPPNSASEIVGTSLDVNPITTRESMHWDSPSTITPVTSVPQENKTLPLNYRLPLTPTKTSPLGISPGQGTTGFPLAQNFPMHQPSLSFSAPNSPAIHAMNVAYQSGTANLSLLDSSRRSHTDPADNPHKFVDTYRARSASPMVHDGDPRLRAIGQSSGPQRSIDAVPSWTLDLGRGAVRQFSPGLGYSVFVPSPNSAIVDGKSKSKARKSSKDGKVVKFRCVVCVDKFRVNKMIQAPHCMHFLCITCVKDLFRRAIRNPEGECPVMCCNGNIPVETVSGFLSAAECVEYSRLVEDYNIPVDKTYCHISTCREVIPPFSISRDSRAKCLRCHSLTCGVCKRGWHTGPCTHWDDAIPQHLR